MPPTARTATTTQRGPPRPKQPGRHRPTTRPPPTPKHRHSPTPERPDKPYRTPHTSQEGSRQRQRRSDQLEAGAGRGPFDDPALTTPAPTPPPAAGVPPWPTHIAGSPHRSAGGPAMGHHRTGHPGASRHPRRPGPPHETEASRDPNLQAAHPAHRYPHHTHDHGQARPGYCQRPAPAHLRHHTGPADHDPDAP